MQTDRRAHGWTLPNLLSPCFAKATVDNELFDIFSFFIFPRGISKGACTWCTMGSSILQRELLECFIMLTTCCLVGDEESDVCYIKDYSSGRINTLQGNHWLQTYWPYPQGASGGNHYISLELLVLQSLHSVLEWYTYRVPVTEDLSILMTR